MFQVVLLKIINRLLISVFVLVNGIVFNRFKWFKIESAKLRALCAKNVLTCQRALCAYVPTCLACLRAHVPRSLARLRAHVPCVLTCQCASFDATIFSFAAIVTEIVHTVGKVKQIFYDMISFLFLAFGNLSHCQE